MAVHSFTKPYKVTSQGAKQLEQMLSEPSPLKDFNHKPKLVTVKELAARLSKEHK